MSGTTFVSNRLEIIESRFKEVDTLLNLAKENILDSTIYTTLCRSAHVLLVSHVEGIYKDIVKDIIDDLNFSTNFSDIQRPIFKTHSLHFIHLGENEKNSEKTVEKLKERLWNAFKDHKTELVLEPFLRIENKNPTPKILDEILKKFGESKFFSSLIESKLEIVFENDRNQALKELQNIKQYTFKGVKKYPYKIDKSYFYNYNTLSNSKNKKGLFEEFLNQFLSDRHKIVHGQILDNPKNDTEILESKIKIEILIYAFIICLCHNSNPVILLN